MIGNISLEEKGRIWNFQLLKAYSCLKNKKKKLKCIFFLIYLKIEAFKKIVHIFTML